MNRWTQINPFVSTTSKTICSAVLLFALQTSVSASAETSIFVTDNAECRTPAAQALACGEFGTLYLADEPQCGAALRTEGKTFFSDPIGEMLDESSSQADPFFPCAGGECFVSAPGGSWVAVIDWNNEHGWSIAETIRQASGFTVDTWLFDLERPALEALEGTESIGDAHVLAQLCQVAQAAEEHPPVAVNMSFGRWAEMDCRPGSDDAACLIGEVTAFLRGTYGTVTFAAAGNGGELLFPALDPEVIAVGALDLAHFAKTGEARALPASPADSAALFPGNGLFLTGGDGTKIWAAPPGSSYASAFAAGWWSGARTSVPRRAFELVTRCQDVLVPRAEGGRLRLACGPRSLPGSHIDFAAELLATALGRNFDRGRAESESVVVVEGFIRAPWPSLTSAEAQARFHRPLPECQTCVPCIAGGSGYHEDDGGTEQSPNQEPTTKPDALTLSGGLQLDGRLDIDLSSSAGVPRDVELLGVYLQAGDLTFRFSDSENSNLLGELALGRIERLVVRGLPVDVGATPLSLAYKLRFADEPGSLFRGSTPILVHD